MAEREPEQLSPRATAVDLHVGSTVDKYTIVKLLGRGGMGAVYEARHAKLSRRFAIKFLLPAVAQNPDILRRFENEAKAAGGLEHPNLAAVTDVGQTGDGAPYLVMEYLEGEDCAKLIERLGPLPVARVVNIVQQACRGLAVVHQAAIVHRDLKPANLFVTDAGDGSDLVKVLDFGIAKLKASESGVATGTGQAFGTAHYMSPEQARGAAEVDARTDVWALGVVLYELLTGRRPFEDGTFLHVVYQILSTEPLAAGALRRDLPPGLVAVVAKAMAKEPSDRFSSVTALSQALTPFGVGGKSAGFVQRSQGFAATMATPATGIRPGGLSALGPGVPSAEAPMMSRPASAGKTKVVVAIVVLAAAVGAGAVWKAKGPPVPAAGVPTESSSREATARPTTAPTPSPAAVGTAAPAAVPSVPERSPEPAKRAKDEPGSRAPEPDTRAKIPSVPERTVRPNGRSKTVRTQFGHSEHGSNIPAASGSALLPAPPALREGAASAPKPAPVADPASAGHPINIDETSPYGR